MDPHKIKKNCPGGWLVATEKLDLIQLVFPGIITVSAGIINQENRLIIRICLRHYLSQGRNCLCRTETGKKCIQE